MKAWRESIAYLKDRLHPNAKYHKFEDSIYKQLCQSNSNLFSIVQDLINDWRRVNAVNKSA